MDENNLHERLQQLRLGKANGQLMLHKPLLLLWLFGRYLNERATSATYKLAEQPVGDLIARFGGERLRTQRDRAALPFVHLERDLWVLENRYHSVIPNSPSRSGAWLREHGAYGSLHPEVVDLLDQPRGIFKAADVLFESYFNADLIGELRTAVGLVSPVPSRQAALKRTTPTSTQRLQRKPVIQSKSQPSGVELPVREAVFSWLAELTQKTGGPIHYAQLANFEFEGKRIAVHNPQMGIHKPAQLGSALSIKTTFKRPGEARPYEDELDERGRIRRYKYQGTDPMYKDNVYLRNAMEQKLPLFWLKGVNKAVYEAHFPLWLTAEKPDELLFEVSFDGPPED